MFTDQDELASHSECETCSIPICSCDDAPCARRVVEAKCPVKGVRCCVECLSDWTAAAEHEKAENRAAFVVEMAIREAA